MAEAQLGSAGRKEQEALHSAPLRTFHTHLTCFPLTSRDDMLLLPQHTFPCWPRVPPLHSPPPQATLGIPMWNVFPLSSFLIFPSFGEQVGTLILHSSLLPSFSPSHSSSAHGLLPLAFLHWSFNPLQPGSGPKNPLLLLALHPPWTSIQSDQLKLSFQACPTLQHFWNASGGHMITEYHHPHRLREQNPGYGAVGEGLHVLTDTLPHTALHEVSPKRRSFLICSPLLTLCPLPTSLPLFHLSNFQTDRNSQVRKLLPWDIFPGPPAHSPGRVTGQALL